MFEHLSLLLKTIPQKPGVYQYFDENGTIIYIGKAKNLKKRVNSYFNKNHDSAKLRILVTKIRDIKTIVVDSEWEALLLENSMIKKNKPRYNAMLKDDKTYPWIAISKEPFPRIYTTRKPDKEREILFGPYSSNRYMTTLLETISDIFPLRTCKILKKSNRACLEFQLKNCAAPCIGNITPEKYQSYIDQAINLIKGNRRSLILQWKEEMMAAAEAWQFEEAHAIKQRIEILESYSGKSTVVNVSLSNCDVFSVTIDEDDAYINMMRVNEGAIIQSFNIELKNNINKTTEELLEYAIVESQQRLGNLAKEIIVPIPIAIEIEGVKITVPVIGDKKKLLELSIKNGLVYKIEKQKKAELIDPNKHQNRILETLQRDLGMANRPNRIECFDNSNTQGSDPVAGMVCFIDGKPAKKEYRHFNIKTVEGPDDFASMQEVVYRRYKRVLDEQLPLPDLIVIDGGKGQLNAAYSALQELKIEDRVMIIGIAKRLEDIFKVGDSFPLAIDKKSEAQKLLQRIRDEVHRFGITHHKKRRSKTSIHSELDDIKGIGTSTKEKLLKHFKSVKRMKAATLEEMVALLGQSKGVLMFNSLNQKSQ